MFRIYFNDIGKTLWDGNIEVEAETLGEVETIALFECRKRAESRFITLHHLSELRYCVYDGLSQAGTVKIRSL